MIPPLLAPVGRVDWPSGHREWKAPAQRDRPRFAWGRTVCSGLLPSPLPSHQWLGPPWPSVPEHPRRSLLAITAACSHWALSWQNGFPLSSRSWRPSLGFLCIRSSLFWLLNCSNLGWGCLGPQPAPSCPVCSPTLSTPLYTPVLPLGRFYHLSSSGKVGLGLLHLYSHCCANSGVRDTSSHLPRMILLSRMHLVPFPSHPVPSVSVRPLPSHTPLACGTLSGPSCGSHRSLTTPLG